MKDARIRDEVLEVLYSLAPLAWLSWSGPSGNDYMPGRDAAVLQLKDAGILSSGSRVGSDGWITAQFSPRGRREYQEQRSASDQDVRSQLEEEIRLGRVFN